MVTTTPCPTTNLIVNALLTRDGRKHRPKGEPQKNARQIASVQRNVSAPCMLAVCCGPIVRSFTLTTPGSTFLGFFMPSKPERNTAL